MPKDPGPVAFRIAQVAMNSANLYAQLAMQERQMGQRRAEFIQKAVNDGLRHSLQRQQLGLAREKFGLMKEELPQRRRILEAQVTVAETQAALAKEEATPEALERRRKSAKITLQMQENTLAMQQTDVEGYAKLKEAELMDIQTRSLGRGFDKEGNAIPGAMKGIGRTAEERKRWHELTLGAVAMGLSGRPDGYVITQEDVQGAPEFTTLVNRPMDRQTARILGAIAEDSGISSEDAAETIQFGREIAAKEGLQRLTLLPDHEIQMNANLDLRSVDVGLTATDSVHKMATAAKHFGLDVRNDLPVWENRAKEIHHRNQKLKEEAQAFAYARSKEGFSFSEEVEGVTRTFRRGAPAKVEGTRTFEQIHRDLLAVQRDSIGLRDEMYALYATKFRERYKVEPVWYKTGPAPGGADPNVYGDGAATLRGAETEPAAGAPQAWRQLDISPTIPGAPGQPDTTHVARLQEFRTGMIEAAQAGDTEGSTRFKFLLEQELDRIAAGRAARGFPTDVAAPPALIER